MDMHRTGYVIDLVLVIYMKYPLVYIIFPRKNMFRTANIQARIIGAILNCEAGSWKTG